MKKMNFKWLVMLCMAMGFATVAKAQIYSSETCYYRNTEIKNNVRVVRFEGSNKRVMILNFNANDGSYVIFEKRIRQSTDYFEQKEWKYGRGQLYRGNFIIDEFEYDSQLSTTKREVYRQKTQTYSGHVFYHYYGFSKDKKTIIEWNSMDPDNRRYWSQVSKEDFLPKAINPNEFDFLNE